MSPVRSAGPAMPTRVKPPPPWKSGSSCRTGCGNAIVETDLVTGLARTTWVTTPAVRRCGPVGRLDEPFVQRTDAADDAPGCFGYQSPMDPPPVVVGDTRHYGPAGWGPDP